MSKNLIIVESPNKIQTIKSYLNNDYEIIASYGHLREMDSKNGYNKETYEPNWTIIKTSGTRLSKQTIVKQIVKAASTADNIFLATDPDREGEAISWHIYDLINDKDKSKCRRITFNEISKKAILNSIENQHELNMDLVHSQFARRVVDRIIGYKLSDLVRRTVYGKSAGRVQSVALMFIVSRELERRNFVPSKWYEISAKLSNNLELTYTAKDKNYSKYTESESSKYNFKFANLDEAQKVMGELSNKYTFIEYSEPKESKGDIYKPLTTDKMLQIAGSSLGWSASKTTLVAQKLFEGIEFSGKHLGLITYPRTDSTRMNEDFIKEANSYIAQRYGNEFVNLGYTSSTVTKKTKVKTDQNVQDAHEAIRPVDPTLNPEDVKSLIGDAEYRLYKIIWSRTMAVLMKQPIYITQGMHFDNNGHEFYVSNKQIKFKGYLVLDYYSKVVEQFNKSVPKLDLNKQYDGNAQLDEFDKQPPSYFTEATLIAALKESGVGRPSTYAAMAKISETRGYVNKEGQKLIPTEIGMKVIDELKKDFPDVIDSKFTANMENELDKIANGNEKWTKYLETFAPEFESKIKQIFADNQEKKKKEIVKAGRECPDCGSDLVIRESKFGTKFVACSAFPKCRYAEFDNSDKLTGEKCPECNHDLIKRFNKMGQTFVGCSNFPKCRYIKKENNN